ncbi:outer membrane beta-barrel protein [Acidocella sp.]|uniref:outer membrane beta-barrel protein n=1 Tax=Acidocella sp. TaxID=50710 RepID=UPI002625342B|nr:outer membrane beta-barrel protein [Acidocella sp.]
MITMRRQLLGLGFVAASSLFALHAAQAMSGPTAITIDGGPLGSLALSGGVDGYGYYLGETNNNGNMPGTNKDIGANVANGLVQLQKTSGVLQFTVEVGSNGGAVTLGTAPTQTSISNFSTGPLYAGYVTVAPTGSPFTVSVGQMASLEGYESAIDWNNANQFTTGIFYVENAQDRGVQLNYSQGPVSASVQLGDGYDTGVFNFLQALASYSFNSNNMLSVYYAGNLGRTGLNAHTYAGTGNYNTTSVGAYGSEFDNSQMVGAYYSYTIGNLNVVPEVQYQIAKADAQLGQNKATSNFGAAVFGDYSFANTPYSLGGWVEYFTSHTSSLDNSNWFIAPDAEAVGFSASPTWQYKDLFARADVGYLYLLNRTEPNGTKTGFGSNANSRGIFQSTLEAGLLF